MKHSGWDDIDHESTYQCVFQDDSRMHNRTNTLREGLTLRSRRLPKVVGALVTMPQDILDRMPRQRRRRRSRTQRQPFSKD